MNHTACISLGANINPDLNLYKARDSLGRVLEILKASSIWESPDYGGPGPNFLNAALLVQTRSTSDDLKWKILRDLESRMGRVRSSDKYAPRTIDLDVMVFDGIVLDVSIWELAFLAVPCAEILPDLINHATNQSLFATAKRLSAQQEISLRFQNFSDLSNFQQK
jgi:2-amino-4-hydroxy-6-hydroxymethyldihydropteridine diphosphokinase